MVHYLTIIYIHTDIFKNIYVHAHTYIPAYKYINTHT